jgi:predicted GNAT family N-acyltransferase
MIFQSVTDPQTLQEIYLLRTRVFVNEQGVNPQEEFDAFEEASIHWAACSGDKVIGCARHRRTRAGFKIERMAVLEEFRNQGVGSRLLLKILETLVPEMVGLQPRVPGGQNLEIYLHAQVQALPFYLRMGFVRVGELFYEAGIAHYRCIYQGMAA